jgi:MoxR-like ATPase
LAGKPPAVEEPSRTKYPKKKLSGYKILTLIEARENAPTANLGKRFEDEISRVIVGREEVIRLMLVALLSGGHILLEGNPGLGKTTLAKAFAQTIGGEFKRVQMTPDVLPSDILGTYVFDQKTGQFRLRKGPIFGNVILVDELNRATPKAQAALLEAMQERQVSFEERTLGLPDPFIVIGTQVSFGTTGTYPLSEVQSDRFAYSTKLNYPSHEERISIISRINEIQDAVCSEVVSSEELFRSIGIVREILVADSIKKYIVSLIDYLGSSEFVRVEPSVRASIAMIKGARALAFLEGRDYVIPDDVKFLAPFALAHRVFLKPEAMVEDVQVDTLLSEMKEQVPVPRE